MIRRGGQVEKIVEKVAWTLVAVGCLTLLGYAGYSSFDELFNESDLPMPVKAAVPIALIGVLVLVALAVKDRLSKMGKENFRKDDK